MLHYVDLNKASKFTNIMRALEYSINNSKSNIKMI